jgi:putative flippase GtrA
MEKQKYLLTDNTFKRFVIIGIVSNILNFTFYTLIFLIFSNIVVSSVVGYSLGVLSSYYFGKVWVFESEQVFKLSEMFKFMLIYIIGGLGMTLIIIWLNQDLNIDYQVSWIGGAIFAIINNYLGSKYIVFKKQ